MGIIQTTPALTPTQIAKVRIQYDINRLYAEMKRVYVGNYNMVWNCPTATPAQILAEFGADGVELFRLSALLRDTIEAAKPGTLPDNVKAAPVAVTLNADGTVTVQE